MQSTGIDCFTKGRKTAPLPILRLILIMFSISLLYFLHADAHAALSPFLCRRRRSNTAPPPMGINGFLQELPDGDSKTSACVGFEKLDLLRGRLVDINTGTLIYA